MNSISTRPTAPIDSEKIGHVVTRLVDNAKAQERPERRSEPRHPFFSPVSVTTCGGTKCWSAFAREISRSGIGLLHNMPLEPSEVMLTIGAGEAATRFRTELIWCRPCGEGWYLSGGRFLDVVTQG